MSGILILLGSCHSNTQFFREAKIIDHYPSGSAIEYIDQKFYLMGDDATYMVVLDSNLKIIDSISVFPGKGRLEKSIKPDIESITFFRSGKDNLLFMAGSGSFDTLRNKAVTIDPLSKSVTEQRLDTFFTRLKNAGLEQLNIEGMTKAQRGLILSNRGNKSFPKNHLIFTQGRNFLNPVFHFVKVGFNSDTLTFQGVSGLAYDAGADRLILSVSTEDTRNAFEDGAIGKSYLWFIDNISSKQRWTSINPNRVIDLDKLDPAFKGSKVESVCIVKKTKRFYQLVLAADNDDGATSLFRIDVSKH